MRSLRSGTRWVRETAVRSGGWMVLALSVGVACGGGKGKIVDASGAEFDGKTGDAGGTSTRSDSAPEGGGAGSTPDCFPDCIARVRRECLRPTTGSCTHEFRGNADQYCYSNGVKEIRTSPPFVKNLTVTFMTPKGAICYSTEDVSGPAAATVEVVFRGASGKEVARGMHPYATFKWTIVCDGRTFQVDESDPACTTVLPGQCADGTCR